jgi:hypothetical protein
MNIANVNKINDAVHIYVKLPVSQYHDSPIPKLKNMCKTVIAMEKIRLCFFVKKL